MDKYVGLFWIVYDQIQAYKVEFDGDKAVIEDGVYSCGKTHEEAWPLVKTDNLPNTFRKEPPKGEVVYDTSVYKFVIYATPKVVHDMTAQRKIIKAFNLPRFVIFREYED